MAAGREKEGELATMSLEFDYLHRKSPYEMLMGEDDISNDVITLGTYFSMSVYDRESLGKWRWNSNSRDVVAGSCSFSRPAARSPRRACSQAIKERPQELRGTRRMGDGEGLS